MRAGGVGEDCQAFAFFGAAKSLITSRALISFPDAQKWQEILLF